MVERLLEGPRTLIGLDHGFSFPSRYFTEFGVPRDWTAFLEDFRRHWPTGGDNVYVDFVLDGSCEAGNSRKGDPGWRRLVEERARTPQPVFRFIGKGTLGKSTHAGLPWLLHVRSNTAGMAHFWPFDGWEVPDGWSAVVEVYPSLWSRGFARQGRNTHQHDAFSVAEWMRRADRTGVLPDYFNPELTGPERDRATIEGWILGIM